LLLITNKKPTFIASDSSHKSLIQLNRICFNFLFSHILRYVAQQPPPPCPLILPVPNSTLESNSNHDDNVRTVSVIISDGFNQKPQKISTIATIMPALSSIRELISYVPTMKNIATRGDLTGIPYLGDKFDDEDQQLINSISGEPIKQNKNIIRSMNIFDTFILH